MDHIVIRAMARWPDVPAVFGWLSLDRRGRWCLQSGPVVHRGAIEFMNRNYDCSGDGRWYFQNGPQRVFVDLEYTPWIYTLDGSHGLIDHRGKAVDKLKSARLDEEGNLLLVSARGVGLLCDRDLAPISDRFRLADGAVCDEDAIETLMKGGAVDEGARVFLEWASDRVEIEPIRRASVAGEFGFEPRPRAGADGA